MTDGDRRIRVLHVEDDADFAELASTMLEREHADIVVETARDADAGCAALAGGDVDCVVSDFDLPGADGLEFLDRVRERHPELPFILYTGKGSEEIASEAISAGVSDYIQKGSGREQYAMLANRIENAVERHRTETALREERRRFELVGRASADAFWDWDVETGEVERSEGYERIFGFDAEEVGQELGWWIQQVHPDDRETVRRETREAVRGDDDTIEVDYRVRTGEGAYKDAYTRAHIVRDEAGNAVRVVGAVTDVTDIRRRERELRQYETVMETVPDGVFVLDENGVIQGGNEAASTMLGFQRGELIGREFGALIEAGMVDESVVDDYGDAVRRLLSSSTDDDEARFEFEATVGGEPRVFEGRVALRPFEDEFRGTIGIVQDVTRRKEREERLERSERRFEAVFDDPSAFIGLLEPDGTLALVNDTALEFVGADLEEVTGRRFVDTPWWEDEPPEKRAEIETGIERAAAGEFVRFEAEHTGIDGRTIDVEGHIRPVTDESGRVVSLLVEGIDVTDRLDHERRIEELHATTRELVRAADEDEVAASVVEAVTDILGRSKSLVRLRRGEELRPVAYSDAARDAFGEPSVLAVGEGLPGRVYEDGEPMVFEDLDAVDQGDHPEAASSSVLLPIGDHGTLSIASEETAAFDDSDVAVARVLANNAAVVLDRLEGEQTLRRRERALRRQNERLDRFARMVSHDLRNPLAVAKGNLELVAEEVESSEFEKVDSALDRMAEIVEDVLSLARQGERDLDPDPTDLDRSVRAAWSSVDSDRATLDAQDGLGRCPADASRLQQLFENLFRNAVEHGGADVTVRVGRLDGDDDSVGFYVEDDGPGISDGERGQVFEFGWTGNGEGTGYGLSIVEEIAEAHGWEVAVTEGEAGGARFEVTGVGPA